MFAPFFGIINAIYIICDESRPGMRFDPLLREVSNPWSAVWWGVRGVWWGGWVCMYSASSIVFIIILVVVLFIIIAIVIIIVSGGSITSVVDSYMSVEVNVVIV